MAPPRRIQAPKHTLDFLCPEATCPKVYQHKGYLDRHIKQKHPELIATLDAALPKHNDPLPCSVLCCPHSYTMNGSVDTHIRDDHPNFVGISGETEEAKAVVKPFPCRHVNCDYRFDTADEQETHGNLEHFPMPARERFPLRDDYVRCEYPGCGLTFAAGQYLFAHQQKALHHPVHMRAEEQKRQQEAELAEKIL
ncbi:hypothetical protein MMC30_001707 [Trapelia coarctata]|nr:hypothetical protein [Trapelia coarctata]